MARSGVSSWLLVGRVWCGLLVGCVVLETDPYGEVDHLITHAQLFHTEVSANGLQQATNTAQRRGRDSRGGEPRDCTQSASQSANSLSQCVPVVTIVVLPNSSYTYRLNKAVLPTFLCPSSTSLTSEEPVSGQQNHTQRSENG